MSSKSSKIEKKDASKLIAIGLGALIVFAVINSATGGKAKEIGGRVQDALNPGPSVAVAAPAVAEARAALPKLTVAPLDARDDYQRAAFGPAWKDTAVPGVAAANRCDTRDDILRRDLTADQPPAGCKLRSGTLADPYTGKTITWTAAHPTAVEIDHVVPLGAAWHQGAAGWDPAKRQRFANDPRNLLAVDGPTNVAKSDKLADGWFPPVAFQCKFTVTVIKVKTVYGMPVTGKEHDALERMLKKCPAGSG